MTIGQQQSLQNVTAFVLNAMIQLQVVGVFDQLGRSGFVCTTVTRWLGSRVVSVRRRARVQIAFLRTVHTHCASVHQAAKLVPALLRVVGVTASLEESNGSLPSGL